MIFLVNFHALSRETKLLYLVSFHQKWSEDGGIENYGCFMMHDPRACKCNVISRWMYSYDGCMHKIFMKRMLRRTLDSNETLQKSVDLK